MKQEREAADGVVLTVDAGSSLLGEYVALKSEGRVSVEGMNLAQYDAMVVGRMDALLGLEVLQARAAEAQFAVLSANLVDPTTQEPLFAPYTIIERDGVSFGIIGISDQEVAELPDMQGVSAYLDPTETAARYVAELRDQVDVVIVLSRLGLAQNHALAAAVPGINIIVGGKTKRLLSAPEREGNTLIVEMSSDGERGGKLQVFIGSDGVPYDYTETVVNLTVDFADDPETLAMIERYKQLYPEPTPIPGIAY